MVCDNSCPVYFGNMQSTLHSKPPFRIRAPASLLYCVRPSAVLTLGSNSSQLGKRTHWRSVFIPGLNTELTSNISPFWAAGYPQSLSLRGPDRTTGAGHAQDNNSAFPGLTYHSLASNLKASCLSRGKHLWNHTHDQQTITKL